MRRLNLSMGVLRMLGHSAIGNNVTFDDFFNLRPARKVRYAKRYPFSSTRQIERNQRQFAAGQIRFTSQPSSAA